MKQANYCIKRSASECLDNRIKALHETTERWVKEIANDIHSGSWLKLARVRVMFGKLEKFNKFSQIQNKQ